MHTIYKISWSVKSAVMILLKPHQTLTFALQSILKLDMLVYYLCNKNTFIVIAILSREFEKCIKFLANINFCLKNEKNILIKLLILYSI
jgi:hypothetical protein